MSGCLLCLGTGRTGGPSFILVLGKVKKRELLAAAVSIVTQEALLPIKCLYATLLAPEYEIRFRAKIQGKPLHGI